MPASSTVSAIESALRSCGVNERTLSPRERDALDRQGYAVFPNVMGDEWLIRLNAVFDGAVAQDMRHGQHIHMPAFDPVFDGIYVQPKVLAAVHHMLRRPFKTFPPVGRDPSPGHGLQALHPDWGRAASQAYQVVTVLWLLDDFTPDNGATRVVPGTHLIPRPAPKALLHPERRHPQEVTILASAGSALVFNAHLLHSGTRNKSGQRRRVLQCQYRARELVLPGETMSTLPAHLPAAARYFLGDDAAM